MTDAQKQKYKEKRQQRENIKKTPPEIIAKTLVSQTTLIILKLIEPIIFLLLKNSGKQAKIYRNSTTEQFRQHVQIKHSP